MIKELIPVETPPLVVHFGQTLGLNDEAFFDFCMLNKDLRIERNAEGDIVIMPPTGGESGRINFSLAVAFGAWAERDGTGVGFDSSTEFALPNGAKRSPDLAWVKRPRWDALTVEEREKFPPLCPDFVVEIRSRTDSLKTLQAKMEEYIANGATLGWLIDPLEKRVHVYRPHESAQVLEHPATISGEPILRGFTLDLERLGWD